MAFTDIERAQNHQALKWFLERRCPPEHVRPQLDIGYAIVGHVVDIFEIRPDWTGQDLDPAHAGCQGSLRPHGERMVAVLDAARSEVASLRARGPSPLAAIRPRGRARGRVLLLLRVERECGRRLAASCC